MPQNLKHITHPKVELTTHYTLRAAQAGAVAGTICVGPMTALHKGTYQMERVSRMSFRFGAAGVGIALICTPVFCLIRNRNRTIKELKQHCYALRWDRSQLRTDRSSLVGAATGYSVSMVLGQACIPYVVFGFCMGMLISDVYGVMQGDEEFYHHKSAS